jgi:hypothetical protein
MNLQIIENVANAIGPEYMRGSMKHLRFRSAHEGVKIVKEKHESSCGRRSKSGMSSKYALLLSDWRRRHCGLCSTPVLRRKRSKRVR